MHFKTQLKVLQKVLILSALLTFCNSLHLNYKKDIGIITLYQSDDTSADSERTLHFQVNFTERKLILSSSLKQHHRDLYLNKHRKNKLLINTLKKDNQEVASLIEYRDFSGSNKRTVEDGEKQFSIDGIIGLSPDKNVFMQIVKESLNHQNISLFFGSGDSSGLQILNEGCQTPGKLPIKMSVDGHSKVDLAIPHLSCDFAPDPNFVKKVTGKSNSPFSLSQEEYFKKVKLEINSKVKEVTTGQLLHKYCSKITASQSYECEIPDAKTQSQIEYGSLPFAFDFSICESGVQAFSNSIQPQQTYYWLHYLLLLLQAVALTAYLKQEAAIRFIKKMIKSKMY